MKIFRWVAAAALTLISLMNVGIVVGGDDSTPLAVTVLVPILGVLGLVSVYGLMRRRHWGQPATLAVSAINLVVSIIALALDDNGAIIGVVVSAVVVMSAFVASLAEQRSRQTQPSLA